MNSVYLDHAATTPLDEEVLEEMLPFLKGMYGNPSSVHSLGRKARSAIEQARNSVASILGAQSSEIIFTSGATEANNTAICVAVHGVENPHIITSKTEHEAVIEPCEHHSHDGCQTTFLTPDSSGVIRHDHIKSAIKENTRLISIMHTNNETGRENETADIASIKGNALYHCDAVQAVGKRAIDVKEMGIDLLSLSAHKFYGPKGIGALYVNSEAVEYDAIIRGGSQEQGRRAGTENVAGIVGLAKALKMAVDQREEWVSKMYKLRAELISQIETKVPKPFRFNSETDPEKGAPHIVSLSFPPKDGKAIDGEMLLFGCRPRNCSRDSPI